MPSKAFRKDAARQYKMRPPRRGVFALRCGVTDRVWVGASTNVEAIHNRLWSTLRLGAHREHALQGDWTAHGEKAFTFEILELLDPDVAVSSVSDLLKEKTRQWADELNAPILL